MPTYEYECKRGHRFERLQLITASPLKKCVECGAPATRLIGGGAGLIFKGSGFYITDYKRKGSAPKGSKGSEKPCPTPKECGRDTCAAPPAPGD